MSHEMRTPLNAIIGFSQILLLKSKDMDPKIIEKIQNIKVSDDILLGLIEDILDFAKIESGSININESDIEITEYISRIVAVSEISYQKKGVTLDVIVDPLLPKQIRTDAAILDKCHQIFPNWFSS
jgi:signal transduction histidine kinase